MLKYLIFILFIINIITVRSQTAQKYLWPTDASTYMSSSFCEFRDGHYHSAIDIKTWVREGYKCFAIDDGKIERIRMSPFGYGKVVYLRLNDGNVAVYAHLQRFNNKIDKAVREQQLKNERYQLNWYPKNLYVKKGDVIAYTGRTGIGVPHLHFEIRNKNGHPVNPLNFYNQVKDNIRPRIKKFAVVPLSKDATVNSSKKPRTFDVTYIRNGINIIKKPIYVKGRVGLMLSGFDQADGAGNKYGFHETIMNVDGKEIFRITYDELHFSTTRHIYTETYYPFWSSQKEVFHKLFIEPFNPLSFYKRVHGEDGSVIEAEKPRSFEIIVTDFHGNKSILKGELIADFRPDITLKEIARSDSNIYVNFSTESLKDIKLFAGDSLQVYKRISYFEVIEGKLSRPESGVLIKTVIPDTNSNYLKIQITGKNNQISQKVIKIQHKEIPVPDQSYLGKRLVYDFPALPLNSKFISGLTNNTFMIHRLPDGNVEAVIDHTFINEQSMALHIISGTDTIWSDYPQFGKWNPGESTTISWFDSSFSITPAAGSFIDTIIVRADTLSADSVTRILPTLGKIYSLSPNNIPVFKSARIKILIDSLPNWGNWNLFKTNGTNSLSFIGGKIDTISRFITATTNPFGHFVVACDTTPPLLEIKSPVQAKLYSKKPMIKFSISDEHSGIGTAENISVVIDGEFVLPEWDPEDKLVTAKIDKALTPGNHTLTISVKDQSNNITRSAIYFIIR